jgi:hypothetical protein
MLVPVLFWALSKKIVLACPATITTSSRANGKRQQCRNVQLLVYFNSLPGKKSFHSYSSSSSFSLWQLFTPSDRLI